jgi:hypothetical protein
MANGILNFSTTGIPIWNDKNRNHSEKYDKNNRKKKLVKCAAIISRWNISILPVSQFDYQGFSRRRRIGTCLMIVKFLVFSDLSR